MLTNYLKIAIRNLTRNKGYTFINVGGLAVGMACCMIILLFVRDELSYDRFHEKADQIYRVAVNTYMPETQPDRYAISNWLNVSALQAGYPEIESVTRLAPWHSSVKHDGQYFLNDNFFFADSTFFDVFLFPLVQGDPAFVLRDPFTLVMTEEMEQKYFGEDSGLGKTVILSDTLSFTVTGIVSNVPANSHFTFDFLVSWTTFENLQPLTNQYTYILLNEGVSPEILESKISDLIMRNPGDNLSNIGVRAELELQPLTKIYLHSDRSFEIGPTGNVQYIYIFTAIAVFILLIACINFINLSTARSVERANEVGVRKAMGSSRGALVRQFLSESVLIAFFALFMGTAIASLTLPFLNKFTAREITFSLFLEPFSILGLAGLVLVFGMMAGIYPALVLSRFKPVEVLKGVFMSTGQGVQLRKGLVIFQFTVSAVLIIGTLIMLQQLNYMQHQHLGFDKEQVVVVDGTGIPNQQMEQQYRTVKQEFKQHPSVEEISASNLLPGRGTWVAMVTAEGLAEDDSRRMQVVVTDHDFLKTIGLELVAGRNFSAEIETDAQEAVLLNEAAVENFGWDSPEEALGKYIRGGDQEFTVVGVMKNYHHQSLRQKIEPMIMRIIPSTFNYFSVRFTTRDVPALLADLERTWQSLFPGRTFEYFFLDDDFNKQYQTEQQQAGIFGAFTFLAILIACLGLFGLAVLTARQRTKEISIRKVLGASVAGIVALLNRDFLKLVIVGYLIAVPISWYAMNRWLADFAYRIEIGPGVFLLAGAAAILIALATVSWQSVRAALMNPVNSLRSE